MRIGRKLIEVPELDQAFREGVLSWSKVKTLIPVVTKENGHAWIVRAMRVSVNDLAHIVGGRRDPIVAERMVPMTPVSMDVWLSFQEVARMLRLHTGSKELSDDECLRQIIQIARGHLTGATARPAMEPAGTPGSPTAPGAAPSSSPSSRHVPVRVRREVRARARNRCENEGCDNLLSPQLHHAETPFGEGGGHTPGNLELWCRRCHDFVHSRHAVVA